MRRKVFQKKIYKAEHPRVLHMHDSRTKNISELHRSEETQITLRRFKSVCQNLYLLHR